MKLNKMICFALLACMPIASFATKSSSIPLSGGTAMPGQAVIINGDKLYDNAFYDVSCVMRMQSKSGETTSHVQVDTSHNSPILVNNHPVPASGQSLITTNEENYLHVTEFRDYGSIQVRNLDVDNSLAVSGCVATPSESL